MPNGHINVSAQSPNVGPVQNRQSNLSQWHPGNCPTNTVRLEFLPLRPAHMYLFKLLSSSSSLLPWEL